MALVIGLCKSLWCGTPSECSYNCGLLPIPLFLVTSPTHDATSLYFPRTWVANQDTSSHTQTTPSGWRGAETLNPLHVQFHPGPNTVCVVTDEWEERFKPNETWESSHIKSVNTLLTALLPVVKSTIPLRPLQGKMLWKLRKQDPMVGWVAFPDFIGKRLYKVSLTGSSTLVYNAVKIKQTKQNLSAGRSLDWRRVQNVTNL